MEYLRTKDPKHSALFASCVASFVVEGIGAATLPTRDMGYEAFERVLGKIENCFKPEKPKYLPFRVQLGYP